MCIYPRSGARGLERLVGSKSYYVQKQQIIFSLGIYAAKNTHHMKKASNKSCSKLNFVQKSPRAHLSICRGCGAMVLENFKVFLMQCVFLAAFSQQNNT